MRFAPTGVDEQAGILLKNKEQEMASVILSLHAKQPKRGTVAFDKGYVEFYDYPRGRRPSSPTPRTAVRRRCGAAAPPTPCSTRSRTWSAPWPGRARCTWHYTRDVMRIMTDIRRQWGMTYPEEE